MASCEAEQVRLQNIERNKQFMQSLGLANAVKSMQQSAQKDVVKARPKVKVVGESRKSQRSMPEMMQSRRRSSRLEGTAPKSYKEDQLEKIEKRLTRSGGDHGPRPEIYEEEHIQALGTFKEEWQLFTDGYKVVGDITSRIYDKGTGETCHQCRQKTLGLRTRCTMCHHCQSHNPHWVENDSPCTNCDSEPPKKGFFCGDCLWMRYGENVKEARANNEWKCPVCRDICNCSAHGCLRSKRQWGPTGTMYRAALAEGYQSVAHYLVYSRQRHLVEQEEKENKEAEETED